ncbi:hypothetical protein AB0K16_33085 [Nonomuraea jabiensis]
MPDRTIRDKALCYIVRGDELLVFRHVLQSGQGALLHRLFERDG